jgi:hypothetical protein
MIAAIGGIVVTAVLFAGFGLLRRGRESEEPARGCGCAQACGACTRTGGASMGRTEHGKQA